ncbi:hypothetical protein ACLOJK_013331 [Asimina triloba]
MEADAELCFCDASGTARDGSWEGDLGFQRWEARYRAKAEANSYDFKLLGRVFAKGGEGGWIALALELLHAMVIRATIRAM